MAEQAKHVISAKLREYAQKMAAEKSAAGEGDPDRMTVADGQGGITTEKKSIPSDVGESELKRDQPADGTPRSATQIPEGGPDRMTVADGQGGITTSKATPKTDPGEAELKEDQPADGDVRKAAGETGISERAARIRAALTQANPELGERIAKQAGDADPAEPAAPAEEPAATPTEPAAEKQAGAEEPPSLEFSQETLAKIATTILSTDEGAQFAHDLLEKEAGEAAAKEQIALAMQSAQTFDQGEQIKSAALHGFQEKAAAIHQGLSEAGISEEDADAILKQAALHQERIASYEHPLCKAAYAQGMDDSALLAAADEAAGEEGVPAVDEALPMSGESLSEEEIMALLQEMLAAGEITEEDILAAVAATEGAEGAAPAEEEAAAAV